MACSGTALLLLTFKCLFIIMFLLHIQERKGRWWPGWPLKRLLDDMTAENETGHPGLNSWWNMMMTSHTVFICVCVKKCVVINIDGVARLETASTNRPIVHPPGDMWVWRATAEWYWQGKTDKLQEKPVPMPRK
jgi:hypothetical protein